MLLPFPCNDRRKEPGVYVGISDGIKVRNSATRAIKSFNPSSPKKGARLKSKEWTVSKIASLTFTSGTPQLPFAFMIGALRPGRTSDTALKQSRWKL